MAPRSHAATPDAPREDIVTRPDPPLHVVPGPDDARAATPGDAEVRAPGRVLRVATTVRGVLDELRGTEPDEDVRRRLVHLHDRTMDQLGDLLGPDLVAELDSLALADPDAVSAGELRVVLAELVGWLEGLFHGMSADLVDDERADAPTGSGPYL
jgi:hypothetical protein